MSRNKILFLIAKTVFGIIVLMLIFSFVYSACRRAFDFGFRIFAEEPVSPAPGHTISVAIVDGKTVMETAEILESKGLIRDSKLFYFEELFSDYHGRLKPGIYEFSTAMTPFEMMDIMASSSSSSESGDEEEISGNSEPETGEDEGSAAEEDIEEIIIDPGAE